MGQELCEVGEELCMTVGRTKIMYEGGQEKNYV